MWPKGFKYFWSVRNLYTLVSHILPGNESTTFTKTSHQKFSIGKQTSCFTIFEGRILKQNYRRATKEIYDFLIVLQLSQLVQSNIFWRCAYIFHWKQPSKILSDIKKVKKLLFLSLKFYKQGQRNATKIICFRTFLPSSAMHFLGLNAQALLEVATKVFFLNLSPSKINIFETNILKKRPG